MYTIGFTIVCTHKSTINLGKLDKYIILLCFKIMIDLSTKADSSIGDTQEGSGI